MQNKIDPKNLTADQKLMMANMVKNAKDVICKCGHNIFNQGVMLKTLSKIITGAEDDTVIPIPMFYCVKCKSEVKIEEKRNDNCGVIDLGQMKLNK